MHYYQFNIGDYLSHTRHLTPTEDICYRRLLDWYYLHEIPIINDKNKIIRQLCLTPKYLTDIEHVLSEFFVLTNEGWINHRADKEIQQYQSFSVAGKRGAAKRWSKDSDKPPNTPPTPPYSPPIETPLANNKQETLNIKQETLNTNQARALEASEKLEGELTLTPLTKSQTQTLEIAAGLRVFGFLDFSSIHPSYLKLIEAGATAQEFIDCARDCNKKSFGFLLAKMIGRRKDAEALELKAGAPPSKPMKGLGVVSDDTFKTWLEPNKEVIEHG